MYEKHKSHSNVNVRKTAKQFLFSFQANAMMEVKSTTLAPINLGYQNNFEASTAARSEANHITHLDFCSSYWAGILGMGSFLLCLTSAMGALMSSFLAAAGTFELMEYWLECIAWSHTQSLLELLNSWSIGWNALRGVAPNRALSMPPRNYAPPLSYGTLPDFPNHLSKGDSILDAIFDEDSLEDVQEVEMMDVDGELVEQDSDFRDWLRTKHWWGSLRRKSGLLREYWCSCSEKQESCNKRRRRRIGERRAVQGMN
ncbi:hypothetical protein Vadar_003451 [Vaccinium darrowii]|uniref:Uncharacterized protein n=1 Tax=Vaccinium darrowii TaxID=229202 RepID=A0ACB7X7Q1_9ERIC|nr:hypothetical protein Vadar_003451 [Vaccinium darrowii]